MNVRKIVGTTTLALGMFGAATLAQGAALEFDIGVAPPPDRYEVVPAPRQGYLYERGHYGWDGRNYVWHEGRFIQERPGHVWTPYEFARRGETWHFRAGHWDDD